MAFFAGLAVTTATPVAWFLVWRTQRKHLDFVEETSPGLTRFQGSLSCDAPPISFCGQTWYSLTLFKQRESQLPMMVNQGEVVVRSGLFNTVTETRKAPGTLLLGGQIRIEGENVEEMISREFARSLIREKTWVLPTKKVESSIAAEILELGVFVKGIPLGQRNWIIYTKEPVVNDVIRNAEIVSLQTHEEIVAQIKSRMWVTHSICFAATVIGAVSTIFTRD